MTRKLIFFDIDGTLLNHDKELPISTKQAIQTLKERGHYVAIATGRAPFLFGSLREDLGIETYVSFNGQYVVAEKEIIFKNSLHKETLKVFTEFALRHDHPIVYMDHEDMKANIEYHPFVEESIGTLKFEHPAHDPEYFVERDIYQALLFCTSEEEQQYIDTFGLFDFVRWHPVSTDVLPAGGSKAKGIEAIIQHLGFSKSDVYAFGDGLNDIEMLQFVENSVAMGNAEDSVKKAAKHVTKDVNEDGIKHGLELVGLL
ncbi:Cof-type HAD-IIB family hydrolase [Halalkalibacterium ligniniphilum]|uniref:Cof-type HAD-IIB family hydrolase n=1 Tax=Halalkalibacterium ligniniphilum TaxID=1134413 RepID=UPI0004776C32|nr:Cof-type HAD-IIB family hydrolase [Halalkalibacterium ligniniphilum]